MSEHSSSVARKRSSADRNSPYERRLDRMNLTVLALQTAGWATCLVILSRTDELWVTVPVVLFFCLMMQGVFSMMHECFHAHGHRSRHVNDAMAWLSSTLFGASATFIRVNHLGHHVRNRTRAELVDFVEDGESRIKKTIAYYAGIAGGIWLGASLMSVLLLFVPSRAVEKLKALGENNTYAAAFADFTTDDYRRIRIEVIAAVIFWVSAWQVLGLEAGAVLLAYVAFAVSWSSLQWIYHVRTPIDVVEGAYNLRASTPIRLLFLNFNYNLTHHRDSSLRWQRLHAVSDQNETRPFWYGWVSIVLPPRPMPPDRVIAKTYF